MMDGALKNCTTGRIPTCNQCGMCCTSLSGLKSVPSSLQLENTETLSTISRRELLMVLDCPHLTSTGKCGVYDQRQKFPGAFPDCGTFTGQKNGFIWKVCTSILTPLGNELNIVHESYMKGIFDGMNVSFESHYEHQENAHFLWEKCTSLLLKMEEAGWSEEKIKVYFEKTYLFSHFRKHTKLFGVIFFFRKKLLNEKGTETRLYNLLFPPSNDRKSQNAHQEYSPEYA